MRRINNKKNVLMMKKSKKESSKIPQIKVEKKIIKLSDITFTFNKVKEFYTPDVLLANLESLENIHWKMSSLREVMETNIENYPERYINPNPCSWKNFGSVNGEFKIRPITGVLEDTIDILGKSFPEYTKKYLEFVNDEELKTEIEKNRFPSEFSLSMIMENPQFYPKFNIGSTILWTSITNSLGEEYRSAIPNPRFVEELLIINEISEVVIGEFFNDKNNDFTPQTKNLKEIGDGALITAFLIWNKNYFETESDLVELMTTSNLKKIYPKMYHYIFDAVHDSFFGEFVE